MLGQWTDVQSRGDGFATPPRRRPVVSRGSCARHPSCLRLPGPSTPSPRPRRRSRRSLRARRRGPRGPRRRPRRDRRRADRSRRPGRHACRSGWRGQVAARDRGRRARADALEGRVAWIQLASIRADDQVASELASGVGWPTCPRSASRPTSGRRWPARQALFVLDDAEHVIEGVRDVVESLAGIHGLRLLVTTTTPLACVEERVIAVEPLVPPADNADPAALADDPAVRLLIDRAAAAGGDDPADPDECRRSRPDRPAASTACHSRSSSRVRCCASSRRTSSSTGSTPGWTSPPRPRSGRPARGRPPATTAIGACGRRWTGATTCSRPRSRSSTAGSACSAARSGSSG
jgi:hypothetical protein